jgi:hypothetical protein
MPGLLAGVGEGEGVGVGEALETAAARRRGRIMGWWEEDH